MKKIGKYATRLVAHMGMIVEVFAFVIIKKSLKRYTTKRKQLFV